MDGLVCLRVTVSQHLRPLVHSRVTSSASATSLDVSVRCMGFRAKRRMCKF